MGKKIVILGAGITGLTAAWKMIEAGHDVTILEKNATAGGLASTIQFGNFNFDIGSHRIHEKYHKDALKLIRHVLGNQILKRPRKGLIFLNDKMVSYPPSVFHLFSLYSVYESIQLILSYAKSCVLKSFKTLDPLNFETYITHHLGKKIYELFYKPYGIKLWGVPLDKISHEPAKNRLKKFSLSETIHDLINTLLRRNTKYYYYPKQGIGSVGEAIQKIYIQNGGNIVYQCKNISFDYSDSNKIKSVIYTDDKKVQQSLQADCVVSTIPIKALNDMVSLSKGQAPALDSSLRSRGLRILYLVTPHKIKSENETFYIPSTHYKIGRVSELNLYSPSLNQKSNLTGLTIEIPSTPGDSVWEMTDIQLLKICVEELHELKILASKEVGGNTQCFTSHISDLYPIYELGWKEKFNKVFDRINEIENLYSIGRSALFLHCNIDHCMVMANDLAKLFAESNSSKEQWKKLVTKEYFNFSVKD